MRGRGASQKWRGARQGRPCREGNGEIVITKLRSLPTLSLLPRWLAPSWCGLILPNTCPGILQPMPSQHVFPGQQLSIILDSMDFSAYSSVENSYI